jgi:pimeloyl-ACP methyl ester carboxylesterase
MMMTSTTIKVHGYQLRILEGGAGPAVLLLHGLANTSDDWRPTLELLTRAGYRAVAVDALGFGESEKPPDAPYSLQLFADLNDGLLDALGIEQAAVVAHSFGGKLALATAVLHPQRVRQLMLVDSEGFIEIPLFMKKSGKIPMLGEAILALSSHPRLLNAQLRTFFYDPKCITPELFERARGIVTNPDFQRMLIMLSRYYDNHDLRRSVVWERLRELTCPTLIVWGAQDRIFAPASALEARRRIPGARLVYIPHCGHFPQVEAARTFHGLLLGFLAAGTR